MEQFLGQESLEERDSVMDDEWATLSMTDYMRLIVAQTEEEIGNAIIMMEGMIQARIEQEVEDL